jgi:choice-of-anchor B domain-containing protein
MPSFYKNQNRLFILLAAALMLVLGVGRSVRAQEGGDPDAEVERQAYFDRVAADIESGPAGSQTPVVGTIPCENGFAGIYPCENVDLVAFMPLATIGGGSGNDIWGWTDPLDGKEYALMGRSSGTAFIDISDPENPVYLGNLPPHGSNSTWRDIKVNNNVAYIVSEASGHGMQVFDLTRLRNVIGPPVTFTEDAHYSGFGNAHNLVINQDTGYAYGVGTSTCSGGLHFVNIQSPLAPTAAGCYSGDGYTHDAQCVVYSGPDADYQGDEICFAYNADTLTIVDVTVKNSPSLIAREGYPGSGYTHQGWVTEDQIFLLLDDELDESNFGHNTRTRIWDISDLDNPDLIDFFDSTFASIDHNQYILNGYAYQSNYTSGLQILDLIDIASGDLSRAAYFDTYPASNGTIFNGSWSNYPFFESGIVIVSDINSGLFILKPNVEQDLHIYLPVVIKK